VVLDIQNIAILLVAGSNLFFGLYVLLKKGNTKSNYLFSFVTLSVVAWCLSMILYRSAIDVTTSIFWAKALYLSAAIIPFIFLWFVFDLVNKKKINFFLKSLFSLPFLFVAFSTIFPNWVIKDVILNTEGEKSIVFGNPYYLIFVGFIFVYFSWAFINLLRKYSKSRGIEKAQVRYIFVGSFLASFIAMTTNLSLPTFGIFSLNWVGQVASITFIGFIAYAMVRYRLMDIRVVLGKTAVYFFASITTLSFSYLTIYLVRIFSINGYSDLTYSVITLLSVLIFFLFVKVFKIFMSRYFYYTFYSYQTVLSDLGKKISQILDMEELSEVLVGTVMDTMKLDKAVILQRLNNGKFSIIENRGFKEDNGISMVKDNFLTNHLEKTESPLVYQELFLIEKDSKTKAEKSKVVRLRKNMKKIEAELCLPLLKNDKINGLIVLGGKISGEPYTKEDLRLLETLSSQISISFQNAKLYEQIEDFSETLQDKVNEQTKELREAYEELKRIDNSKTEFISMASHQLRTPLTAIKGYLSLLVEKEYGDLNKKEEEILINIFNSNERLIKMVNEMLSISRIDLGKIGLEQKKVQITDMLKSIHREMAIKAKDRGLKFSFVKPKEIIPEVLIDELKIRQVVQNLVDNAIKYTEKGKVEIGVERKKKSILVYVKDSGAGLNDSEKETIFDSFARGTAGLDMFIEGTGLGLYVARKYMDLHNGKIWVDSAGPGKGSTFFVELLIKK
jgi:signal transduction histidine kinase